IANREMAVERANIEVLMEEQRQLAESEFTESQSANNQLLVVNQQLNETVTELNQLKETLEERVIQRTRDLEAARIEAVKASEAKGDFLANVSHELRTPLTSILGFSQAIQRQLKNRVTPELPDNEKVDKAMTRINSNLTIIINESNRLANLINDVLDLSKIESGKMDWDMAPVDLNEVVQHGITSTASLYERKDLTVSTSLSDTLPTVLGDNNKLVQVIINLISNAVKFTASGSVTIATHQRNGHVVVDVSDTGIGVPEENLNTVFEKFRQVGDTLTDKPEGTGLGLPICKEIIEHHGGTIQMKSELGKGTTVTFELPVQEGLRRVDRKKMLDKLQGAVRAVQAPQPSDAVSDVQTILIADDEAPVRQLLRELLEDAGYRVREAVDGRDALNKIAEELPDLLLLDIMMPQIDGFSVARTLKEDANLKNLPIIIVSIVEDEVQGYQIGVDRYLTKPIDTEKLLQYIQTLLSEPQSPPAIFVRDGVQNNAADQKLKETLLRGGYRVHTIATVDELEQLDGEEQQVIIINAATLDPAQAIDHIRKTHKNDRSIIIVD
ncbi:MAG: ATP-binding protein, partial [Chloroflexota bacterium]